MNIRIAIVVVIVLLLVIVGGFIGYGAWRDRAEHEQFLVLVESSSKLIDRVFVGIIKGGYTDEAVRELQKEINPQLQKLDSELNTLSTGTARKTDERTAVLLYCRSAATAVRTVVLFAMRGNRAQLSNATQEAVLKFWGALSQIKAFDYSDSSLAPRGTIASFAHIPLRIKPETLGLTTQAFDALTLESRDTLERREMAWNESVAAATPPVGVKEAVKNDSKALSGSVAAATPPVSVKEAVKNDSKALSASVAAATPPVGVKGAVKNDSKALDGQGRGGRTEPSAQRTSVPEAPASAPAAAVRPGDYGSTSLILTDAWGLCWFTTTIEGKAIKVADGDTIVMTF